MLIRNRGMQQHIWRYIRGDAASETMDIYTRVDRDDELVGASVFLTAEEIKEAREEGSIEIEVTR